VLTIELLTKK